MTDQGLEAEEGARGSRLAGERAPDNGEGARDGDEPWRLSSGRKPWTERTLDVAAG